MRDPAVSKASHPAESANLFRRAAGSVSKMFLLEHSHEKPTPFEQLMHYTSDHENMTLNDLRVEWTAELPGR